MRDERKKILEEAGISVEEALERFMGNEMLLEKFLGKFPEDKNFGELQNAFEQGDKETALRAAHTLKGVCANLSIKGLSEKFSVQVGKMREGSWVEAKETMKEIL